MRYIGLLVMICVPFLASLAPGAEPDARLLVEKVVTAAGGKDQLLTLFRFRERLNVSSDPDKKGSERVSVVEPPHFWWLGTKDRGNEPAKFLVWAWTLGALTDPKSKIDVIAEIREAEKPAVGLRVSGTIEPPMEMYFNKADSRLVRIDWRSDIHRFSEWKQHAENLYPQKCVGYKKNTGQPWYFSEILELERLQDLPDGLKR